MRGARVHACVRQRVRERRPSRKDDDQMIGKSLLKYGVCAAVAAGAACGAEAAFVGFVTVKTTLTVPATQTAPVPLSPALSPG